ncbi:unnamed protein product, partial [Meganyctiphanes norvegica]
MRPKVRKTFLSAVMIKKIYRVPVSNSACGRTLPGHTQGNSSTIEGTQSTVTPVTMAGKKTLVGGHGDEMEDASCGWLCLTPACLQGCRTAKWALFWLCWASTVQGMVVNGFINSVITNIEKRFDLRSTDAGVIAGAYDIASVLCAIPVSYFGSRPGASKSRWLGWGMFIMGLGSFCFAAPHFLAPEYNPSGKEAGEILFCIRNEEFSERCTMSAQNWMSKFRIVFIISQFIHGIGSSPLYTLGTTFLDESVPMKMSSIYLGIFYAMGAVGPALGYVLGSIFLKIYVDTPHVDPAAVHDISPDSELWIGGWWIGFLISGALSIIISVPIMAFPDKLPGYKAIQASRVSEAYSGDETSASTGFGNMRDFPRAARTLLANPTFLALSLAGACEGSLMTGFATFTPKFLETQFQIPASRASVLIGLVAVPAAGGGTFLGGWIVKKLKLSCAGIIRVCIILSSLCFLSYFTFTISCPNPQFAGVNIAYDNRPISIYDSNLTGICNANCSCGNVSYDPVCGSNGVVYFSPCHAGCTAMNNESKVYSDCACVTTVHLEELQSPNNISEIGIARRENMEHCKVNCPHMTTFMIVFFIIMLITFVTGLPALTATLRCVQDDQKSLALGLQWIIVRLLGTISGPMIFGSLIDKSCTLWQNTCGITGSCRMYDNPNMSKYMMGVSLFGKFLSTILFIIAWKLYVPPSNRIASSMSCDTMTSTLTCINDSSTLETINESESIESLESFNKTDIELT